MIKDEGMQKISSYLLTNNYSFYWQIVSISEKGGKNILCSAPLVRQTIDLKVSNPYKKSKMGGLVYSIWGNWEIGENEEKEKGCDLNSCQDFHHSFSCPLRIGLAGKGWKYL